MLELKLVSHDGMALSVLTEFVENTGGPDDKQDCELKAAYRLLKRLKELYPKQTILLLADGLYPKGPIFRLCQDAGWKYLFVLQNDLLPRPSAVGDCVAVRMRRAALFGKISRA